MSSIMEVRQLSQDILFSDGTIEEVFNGVSNEELAHLLKTEPSYQHLFTNDCILEDNSEMNGLSYVPIPDSTEQFPCGIIDVPSPTGPLPSVENYSGPCDFDVELSKMGSEKTKWEYSHILNKMFVTIDSKIPINFKWNQREMNLKVRALPIFLQQDSFEEPVIRCATHCASRELSNNGFEHINHIMRCDNFRTSYDKNHESGRLSVVVPLDAPQPGTEWTTVVYTFVCKNSCAMGMNRRQTAIIFTLERNDGMVIGRKMVKFRVCSCPKRDRNKEEKDLTAKSAKPEPDIESEEKAPHLGKKLLVKKPIKRLMTNDVVTLQIPVPRIYAENIIKLIREIVSMPQTYRELTAEEKVTVEACNNYSP